jgi:murein L,D-transpeptidase YafK
MVSKFARCAALLLVVFLAGCAESKFETYNGPEVTKLEVHKADRIIKVFHGNRLLKKYEMELGFGATGHKQFEGDGKTPEGRYTIDRRNPNSSFYLSLGISYPNARDIAYARSQGKEPGGEIFIHGQPNLIGSRGPDWTAGCIAVTNKEMRQLYAMVKNGTTIDIFP